MQSSLKLLILSLSLSFTLGGLPAAAQEKLSTAETPTPRKDQWWMKRQDAMNERVAKGHVDIVFIGDSITQGWEGAGKKVWEKYYGGKNAVNLGIGGDQTQHVLWRLQHGNLQGIHPKLAVLMIGTNNASARHRPEQIAAGIKTIVQEIRKDSPKTKILLLAIFPRGANEQDALRQVNEKTNRIIAKLADNKHVFFEDIGKNFLKKDGELTRDIMPDLLHLSPEGYEIWARSIAPMVERLAAEKQ